jgi:hypothetical protein
MVKGDSLVMLEYTMGWWNDDACLKQAHFVALLAVIQLHFVSPLVVLAKQCKFLVL